MNIISIVIPIHNRLDITKKGLESINCSLAYYKANGNNSYLYKIIIVDDGSTDGSADWIKNNYLDVIVLPGSGDLWWSGAINMGARYAIENLGSDYILLWNDDTICSEDYFYEMEQLLINNPQYHDCIIVSKIYWQHKSNLLFNFGCYFNPKTGKKTIIGLNKVDVYNEIISVDWAGGMGTLIPAKAISTLNYFDDKSFPQYYGDIDFFLKAKNKGFKAFAVPTLKIYNNLESTGINNAYSFKEFKTILLSNRSIVNFKQSYKFNIRHSNTIISWIKFTGKYFFLFIKTLRNIIVKKLHISLN